MSIIVELSLLYRADKYEFTRGLNKQIHTSFALPCTMSVQHLKIKVKINFNDPTL